MYPLWEVPTLGAGMVLALMATFHILPSHLSTSAMWFNIYIETKAYRENRPELLEFIKKYSLMILVFAYVLGSLSGIGIWYAATVASPRGISGLIHNYVWGWATEWVFFLIEVTGIFIYYYTFDKVDRKTHLKIGWIFALGSWTTMVIIVGILAFMLSPGKWPQTGNFFDGFFNQTYWAQLVMRTTLMFVIAAVYALAVAARVKQEEVKRFVVKTASLWGLGALVLGSIAFLWYVRTLPAPAREVTAAVVPANLKWGLSASLGLLILYFLYAYAKPLTIRLLPAVLAIAVLFGGIWSIERMREMIRKPYIIPQYMYSNQIIGKDIPAKGVSAEIKSINEKGILKIAPFVPAELREIKEDNQLAAGKMIARLECASCHILEGNRGLRPLPSRMKALGFNEANQAEGFLEGLGETGYMPPFAGTPEEKKALAAYLISLNKKEAHHGNRRYAEGFAGSPGDSLLSPGVSGFNGTHFRPAYTVCELYFGNLPAGGIRLFKGGR